MSIKAINHVWEHSAQRGSSLVLLLAIADMANDDGDCYPGVAKLAEKCNIKERQLQVLLRHLEDQKIITIYDQAGIDTGHGKTNIYRYLWKSEKGDGVHSSAPDGVHSSAPKPPVEPRSDALPESGKASVREPAKTLKKRERNPVFDKVAEYAFGIHAGDPVGNGTAARVGKILAELKTSHGGQYPAVSDITQACLAWKYAHRGLDLPRDPAKFDAMIREWEQQRSTPPAPSSEYGVPPGTTQAELDAICDRMFRPQS